MKRHDRTSAGLPRSPRRCRTTAGARARGATKLRSPLDAGVTLRSRRPPRARARGQLRLAAAAALAVVALFAGWQLTRLAPQASTTAAEAQPTPDQVGVSAPDRTEPTPLFASYQTLQLYLPIACGELSEIAYHQASGDKALSIVSMLPDADMAAAAQAHGTGRAAQAGDATGTATQSLTGTVLRMWRSNRTGPPDTAVDVGAVAGTTVYAPVTGDVVEVKPYLLYDQYDDYEIHIRPAGWPDIDLVMIHVDAPRVQAGDRVIGGVTALAEVRLLSDRITHQLSAYTTDGGNHVHLQLNRVEPDSAGESLDGS